MEIQDFVGGTSHAPASVMRQIAGEDCKMFSWGFVREPLDRFVSAFFHQPRTHGFQQNNMGFREFIYFMYSMKFDLLGSVTGGGHHHHHFIPQHYFLCDDKDNIIVNFVGRYSQLDKDWKYVTDKIGVRPVKLPHERVSNHAHYSAYYAGDDNLVRMVKELYAKDYEIFKKF